MAAEYIHGTEIKVGFVSTNSICQGEQVSLLWQDIFETFGMHINFAHQTFEWKNEAPKKAAVHVVIVGFWCKNRKRKLLYQYSNVRI